jgi:gluconokinase
MRQRARDPRRGRVLALDLGTSSVRALVTDDQARAQPGVVARRPTTMRLGGDGRAEMNAEQVVAAVADCIDELHAGGHLDAVELVASACFWHSLLGVDAAGDPVTPLLTWADARAAGLAASLRERTDQAGLHARTGAPVHATFWTAKLPWLAHATGTRPRSWLGMAEHMLARLLDEPVVSVSMASGTGLLDIVRLGWDDEALRLAGVGRRALPPLAPRGWTGRLAPALRRRWPALAGARWAPPIGDGAAANLGAGCDEPDKAAVTIGTSAALRVVGGPPDAPLRRELWRYRVDEERVITGAAFSGGGNLYDWAVDVLALPGRSALEAALSEVPPGANGVSVLPFHTGSRAPLDLPGGSGVVAALSLATTPPEILAATLEAVCFQLAGGYEALAAAMPAPPRIIATGGALLASPWWQQVLANVLDRPVALVPVTEASAEGAATLALGGRADPEVGPTVEPQPRGAAAEHAARARHAALAARFGIT